MRSLRVLKELIKINFNLDFTVVNTGVYKDVNCMYGDVNEKRMNIEDSEEGHIWVSQGGIQYQCKDENEVLICINVYFLKEKNRKENLIFLMK